MPGRPEEPHHLIARYGRVGYSELWKFENNYQRGSHNGLFPSTGAGKKLHIFYFRTGKVTHLKIFFSQFYYLSWVYITTYRQGCVIRTVPAQEKVLQVVYINAVQILDIPNGQPGVWMSVWIQFFAVISPARP